MGPGWLSRSHNGYFLSCDLTAVMEVASGEYGDQMVRLVKAVQKDEQAEPNGDVKPQALLWQRPDEGKYGDATQVSHLSSSWSVIT